MANPSKELMDMSIEDFIEIVYIKFEIQRRIIIQKFPVQKLNFA